MSYEGYVEYLCKKGHYWSLNCWQADYDDLKNVCPICKKKPVRENSVDTTNDEGEYWLKETKSEKKCDKCCSLLERTYKITGQHKPLDE